MRRSMPCCAASTHIAWCPIGPPHHASPDAEPPCLALSRSTRDFGTVAEFGDDDGPDYFPQDFERKLKPMWHSGRNIHQVCKDKMLIKSCLGR
ncbi:hypothetical protein GUJ93_ZPchr0008g11959 [Zizania palustris]|uniref:Uncharacterized protein n=1 Tax=Zizania palustris TaxID=103762 RepID=A0A8J5UX27_ZIZPA|nr:hypothetical protein GUJ93_ZPchr0008g11959 [Zizania palustris]